MSRHAHGSKMRMLVANTHQQLGMTPWARQGGLWRPLRPAGGCSGACERSFSDRTYSLQPPMVGPIRGGNGVARLGSLVALALLTGSVA
jgi:hypothetical protein